MYYVQLPTELIEKGKSMEAANGKTTGFEVNQFQVLSDYTWGNGEGTIYFSSSLNKIPITQSTPGREQKSPPSES